MVKGAGRAKLKKPINKGEHERFVQTLHGAIRIRRGYQINPDGKGVFLLVCFHPAEHVRAAAAAQHGDTEEAREWTRDRVCEFRTMSVADALGSIRASGQTARTAAARKELDRLGNDVIERARMLGYKHAEPLRRDIGSVPTEATYKTTTKRMKLSGAKWNLGNTGKIMNLIAARNSNQWTPYWSGLAA